MASYIMVLLKQCICYDNHTLCNDYNSYLLLIIHSDLHGMSDPKAECHQMSFHLCSSIVGGAVLEYLEIAFSASEYLITLSGIPDFKLTVW